MKHKKKQEALSLCREGHILVVVMAKMVNRPTFTLQPSSSAVPTFVQNLSCVQQLTPIAHYLRQTDLQSLKKTYILNKFKLGNQASSSSSLLLLLLLVVVEVEVAVVVFHIYNITYPEMPSWGWGSRLAVPDRKVTVPLAHDHDSMHGQVETYDFVIKEK